MRLTSQSELKKQLLIVDLKYTPLFLEHVKSHYKTHNESPNIIQQKLWILTTSAMDNSMKNKWLERWNISHALRKVFKFPKPFFFKKN